MHSKKGFTLIELLAVIVILAVIALIAIPTLLSIIWKSRVKALEDSCYGLIEAINEQYITDVLNRNEDMITEGLVTDIKEISKEKPYAGTWYLEQVDVFSKNQIIIENVSFPSMKDYVCTNKNTLNNRVECTKGKNPSGGTNPSVPESNIIEYVNENFTDCEEVKCALDELYEMVVKEK